MVEKQESLAEFVTRIMSEKNLSFRKVAKQSGNKLSHSSVAEIATAKRWDIRKDTLIALANGLEVDVADVFRVVRGLPTETAGRYEMYAERFDAHDIEPTEWQYLETQFFEVVNRYKAFKESLIIDPDVVAKILKKSP